MRKIVMRSRARATGKFPSWKTGRMMEWESTNELNAFRVLDCMPDVQTYAEQPCEIVYLDDEGKEARHYPDILVTVESLKELWEVKTAADARSYPVQWRTELLSRELLPYGFTYRIKIAEDFARQPYLSNSLKILYFGRRPIIEIERWQVQQTLIGGETLNWNRACSGNYGSYGREILCRLVLEGQLHIDMNSRISADTQFFPSIKVN